MTLTDTLPAIIVMRQPGIQTSVYRSDNAERKAVRATAAAVQSSTWSILHDLGALPQP